MVNWWVLGIYGWPIIAVIIGGIIVGIWAIIHKRNKTLKRKQNVVPSRACMKCGAQVNGNYCSNCGEKIV